MTVVIPRVLSNKSSVVASAARNGSLFKMLAGPAGKMGKPPVATSGASIKPGKVTGISLEMSTGLPTGISSPTFVAWKQIR
eukprot:CAMPEP_0194046568 /NCGR_PEP_ID=MMETSP0009_2-20130614/21692_1 /TAXON_ID=210454 /ORGANISM="Grammatophora oceanica, Strain CCMP 410" /LENGTH=80 /DNA_ID=CAMNT_0038691923 /DNA_START=47 /DNA_END=289 /DNA_ORIENTATION=-